jgi:hypothetical protein
VEDPDLFRIITGFAYADIDCDKWAAQDIDAGRTLAFEDIWSLVASLTALVDLLWVTPRNSKTMFSSYNVQRNKPELTRW